MRGQKISTSVGYSFINHFFSFKFLKFIALLLFLSQTHCTTFKGPGDLTVRTHPHPSSSESVNDSPPLQKPVNHYRISQHFSPPSNPKHDGIDLAGRLNTPVYASHSGKIIYKGRKYRGYGKMILLEYNNSWATLYAHLNKIYVKPGQIVKKGQLIGAMGRTGRATGVH